MIRDEREASWSAAVLCRFGMKKQLFKELLQSVKQAKAIERGELKAAREFDAERKDWIAISKRGLSRAYSNDEPDYSIKTVRKVGSHRRTRS